MVRAGQRQGRTKEGGDLGEDSGGFLDTWMEVVCSLVQSIIDGTPRPLNTHISHE